MYLWGIFYTRAIQARTLDVDLSRFKFYLNSSAICQVIYLNFPGLVFLSWITATVLSPYWLPYMAGGELDTNI